MKKKYVFTGLFLLFSLCLALTLSFVLPENKQISFSQEANVELKHSLEDIPDTSWSNYKSTPSGSGTQTSPYKISKPEQLAYFIGRTNKNLFLQLTADIDLSAHRWETIEKFEGLHFDGKNHKITGLRSTTGGLFGTLNYLQTICDLELDDCFIYRDAQGASASYFGLIADYTSKYSGSSITDIKEYIIPKNITIKNSEIQVYNFTYAYIHLTSRFEDCINFSVLGCTVYVKSDVAKGCEVSFTSSLYNSTYGRNEIATGKVITDVPCATEIQVISPSEYSSNGFYDIETVDLQMASTFTEEASNTNINFINAKDGITKITDFMDDSYWIEPVNNNYKSVYPCNEKFLEYYNLPNNVKKVEFWKDYGEKPSGDGTPEKPYLISKPEHLAYFIDQKTLLTKNISMRLENDIDLSGKYWTPISVHSLSSSSSVGENYFDGNNKKIIGLTFNLNYLSCYNICEYGDSKYEGYIGLFSRIQVFVSSWGDIKNYYVKDVTLQDVTLEGKTARRATYISWFGSTYLYGTKSGDAIFSNVSILGLNINAEINSNYFEYYGMANHSNGARYKNCSILGANVKINITSDYYEKINMSLFTTCYSPVDICVFEGDVDIIYNTAYKTKAFNIAGFNTSTAAKLTNCLFAGRINVEKINLGNVNLYEFADTSQSGVKQISCMSANSSLSGGDKMTTCSNHNLTELAQDLDAENWSAVDVNSKTWPYIFPLNDKFIEYYNLQASLSQTTWLSHILQPSGDGSEYSPYSIYSPENLAWISFQSRTGLFDERFVYISLQQDIDLLGYKWSPIGTREHPFIGKIDGNNFTISNMDVGYDSSENVGLIGYSKKHTSYSIEIYDLNITNAQVKGLNYAAALIGRAFTTKIENVTAQVQVVSLGNYIAGLIGYGEYTGFKDVEVSGSVNGAQYVGGFVAYSDCGFVNCVNRAEINATSNYTGGFLGYSLYFSDSYINKISGFNNCVNYGAVSGKDIAGGFVGESSKAHYDTKNCINYGNVTGRQTVAGLIAVPLSISARDSINYGKIISQSSNTSTGGLFGHVYGMGSYISIINCKNFGEVYGSSVSSSSFGVGGILGSGAISATIRNCINYGYIHLSSRYSCSAGLGGIVGKLSSTLTIENCINSIEFNKQVQTSESRYAGGIVGLAEYSATIRGCANFRDVTSECTVGGILGYGKSTTNIYNCVSYGNVRGNYSYNGYSGGIVGQGATLTVDSCQVFGTTEATSGSSKDDLTGTGGVVGNASTKGTITNCYVKGKVVSTALQAGGIIGKVTASTTISGCYFDGDINAISSTSQVRGIGCFAGYIDSTLTISNCGFSGNIYRTKIEAFSPIGLVGTGNVVANSLFYSYNLYSKSGQEEVDESAKNYILGADETEETAFGDEYWAYRDIFDQTQPFPRGLLWTGYYIENTGRTIDWLTENGFTLAQ